MGYATKIIKIQYWQIINKNIEKYNPFRTGEKGDVVGNII